MSITFTWIFCDIFKLHYCCYCCSRCSIVGAEAIDISCLCYCYYCLCCSILGVAAMCIVCLHYYYYCCSHWSILGAIEINLQVRIKVIIKVSFTKFLCKYFSVGYYYCFMPLCASFVVYFVLFKLLFPFPKYVIYCIYYYLRAYHSFCFIYSYSVQHCL